MTYRGKRKKNYNQHENTQHEVLPTNNEVWINLDANKSFDGNLLKKAYDKLDKSLSPINIRIFRGTGILPIAAITEKNAKNKNLDLVLLT